MQTFIRHSDSSNDANVVLVAAACCHIFCPFSFAHPAFPACFRERSRRNAKEKGVYEARSAVTQHCMTAHSMEATIACREQGPVDTTPSWILFYHCLWRNGGTEE
ncbi:hypothetical protein Tcan_10053 [Toxocara canis]|uniref:Uncharacterized protein n=1 Tax=Toxocara canis TaxID=6265 RepID=A0A0B2V8V4_TOXCA|nr:hypothetical protein Tcan_10053 [Toxocara canis]